MARQIVAGESVSVNGACLTVATPREERLDFHLLEETLRRTNLGGLQSGGKVNLERALQADGRLGGHFVQGHVDCTSTLLSRDQHKGDLRLEFDLPVEFSHYVAWKGSICVNGVSLTVAELTEKFLWRLDHPAHALPRRILVNWWTETESIWNLISWPNMRSASWRSFVDCEAFSMTTTASGRACIKFRELDLADSVDDIFVSGPGRRNLSRLGVVTEK